MNGWVVPIVAAGSLLSSCVGVRRVEQPAIRMLGVATIARDIDPGAVPMGGLSGIDHDRDSEDWFAISDDKSEFGAARFWKLKIALPANAAPVIGTVEPVTILTQAEAPFPVQGTGAEAIDGESIRVLPGGELIWSTEGDERDGFGARVRRMDIHGRYLGDVSLPAMFARDPTGKSGPRANLSIEGLSLGAGGASLWLSLEAPLHQDGPVAGSATGALVRLVHLAYPSGRELAQFAYPLDPIGPVPPGRMADNGVSEILAIDDRHVLVLERSGVQQPDGGYRFRPRLFCATLDGATDVARMDRLDGKRITPARKRLIFDFETVTDPVIGNVEGMAFGPSMGAGNASLVFVTDDNFASGSATQIIAFAIDGEADSRAMIKRLCRT